MNIAEMRFSMAPEHVYGSPLPEIPKGMRVVGFRLPTQGETWLGLTGGRCESNSTLPCDPRFILVPSYTAAPCTVRVEQVYGRPLEELQPPEGYAFEISDGLVAFRMPGPFDTWLYIDGIMPVGSKASIVSASGPRLILRKKESPAS